MGAVLPLNVESGVRSNVHLSLSGLWTYTTSWGTTSMAIRLRFVWGWIVRDSACSRPRKFLSADAGDIDKITISAHERMAARPKPYNGSRFPRTGATAGRQAEP